MLSHCLPPSSCYCIQNTTKMHIPKNWPSVIVQCMSHQEWLIHSVVSPVLVHTVTFCVLVQAPFLHNTYASPKCCCHFLFRLITPSAKVDCWCGCNKKKLVWRNVCSALKCHNVLLEKMIIATTATASCCSYNRSLKCAPLLNVLFLTCKVKKDCFVKGWWYNNLLHSLHN